MLSLRRSTRLLPCARILLVPTTSIIGVTGVQTDFEGVASRLHRALRLWEKDNYDYLIIFGGHKDGVCAEFAYYLEENGVESDRIRIVILDPHPAQQKQRSSGEIASGDSGQDLHVYDPRLIGLLMEQLHGLGLGEPSNWKVTMSAGLKEARHFWHSFKSCGVTVGFRPPRRFTSWVRPLFQTAMTIDRVRKYVVDRRHRQEEHRIQFLTA